MNVECFQTLGELELRQAESGPGLLTGVALRFGERAKLPGGRTEEIRPGGLVPSVRVYANRQHERGRHLGVSPGNLSLVIDNKEVRVALQLPDTTLGRDVATEVRMGILQGLSVEFRPIRDKWAGFHRIVEQATLAGIGVVDTGAYGGDSLSIREQDTGAHVGWSKATNWRVF